MEKRKHSIGSRCPRRVEKAWHLTERRIPLCLPRSSPTFPFTAKVPLRLGEGPTRQQSGEGPGPRALHFCGWRHSESQAGDGRAKRLGSDVQFLGRDTSLV